MIDNALRAAAADLARKLKPQIPSARAAPFSDRSGASAILVSAAPGSDLTKVPSRHLGYPVRARFSAPPGGRPGGCCGGRRRKA